LEALPGLSLAVVLWLGGREGLLHQITPGQFIAYLVYVTQLTWPIIPLGWVVNLFYRGTASMGRINEILVEQPEVTDRGVAPSMRIATELRGDIELRNLNFAYNGTPVLRNVNLTIPAGTSLAVVGPTGSGKSTLVSLIPRIYDAASGQVLIDGRTVR